MKDWFIWKGSRCTDYGIHVLMQPDITVPAERATFTDVPGRSGSLTTLQGEDVYDDMILPAECIVSDMSRINDIAAYLKGGGQVTFACRPGGYYEADSKSWFGNLNEGDYVYIVAGSSKGAGKVHFWKAKKWSSKSGKIRRKSGNIRTKSK